MACLPSSLVSRNWGELQDWLASAGGHMATLRYSRPISTVGCFESHYGCKRGAISVQVLHFSLWCVWTPLALSPVQAVFQVNNIEWFTAGWFCGVMINPAETSGKCPASLPRAVCKRQLRLTPVSQTAAVELLSSCDTRRSCLQFRGCSHVSLSVTLLHSRVVLHHQQTIKTPCWALLGFSSLCNICYDFNSLVSTLSY